MSDRRRAWSALALRVAGLLVASAVAAALLAHAGCYMGTAGAGTDGGGGGGGDSGLQGGGDGGVSGLPCDVANVLATACTSCHSSPPTANAPMSLVSYTDLTAMSAQYPSQTVAQRCVARMQDSAAPMPPGGPLDATGAGVIQAWITAGYQRGSCGSPDGGTNPYGTAPTCTSGQYVYGSEGGSSMHPGGACNTCHAGSGEAPIFSIAGTVFPTAHEYDDCASPASALTGAQVVITDANGGTYNLTVGSTGNFTLRQSIPLPYHAKVVQNGRERAMVSSQQSGDCNSCHTLNGTNGAPGRVMLP